MYLSEDGGWGDLSEDGGGVTSVRMGRVTSVRMGWGDLSEDGGGVTSVRMGWGELKCCHIDL